MNLETLQREMAAAIMLPLTPDEEMRAKAPDGRSMASVAESFIASNSRLSAFERLEIYNRQYWFRVQGALAEDFPALQLILGARAFEVLSVAYLTAHPSRSFTLRNLGSQLVDWLAQNPRWAGRRHRLALDVARIEWNFVEAFDSEALTPLTLDQIAALDSASTLALQPHLRLLALDYPADDLVLGLRDRQKRESTEAGLREVEAPVAPAKLSRLPRRPTWLAAHRVDLAVYYRRLDHGEFLTLSALRQGTPIAQALEVGFDNARIPDSRRPEVVRNWFTAWAELGWLCAKHHNDPIHV